MTSISFLPIIRFLILAASGSIILLFCNIAAAADFTGDFSYFYARSPYIGLGNKATIGLLGINRLFVPFFTYSPQSDSTGQERPVFFSVPPSMRNPFGVTDYAKHPPLPPGYRVSVTFDSTVSTARAYEDILGIEMSPYKNLPLDEYLALRREQQQRRLWDSLVAQYDIRRSMSGRDLASIISQATGLNIPVPQNPIFSIFGKPSISINVSGDVNLRAGWRWDSQKLGAASAFGQTQSGPLFSQDINLNVQGKIGDKLGMNVDWNTRQQFDLNNRFNIGFTGNDDDIIKRVELGNVQFPTPSALIGSGQALFGARADFQFGPLFLKTVASQRRGERKFIQARGGTVRQSFQLRAYDYARNHFLLDTVYKSVFREYYRNAVPVIPPSASQYRVKEIEVWESTGDVREQATAAEARLYAEIVPRNTSAGQRYPDSMKRAAPVAGQIEAGKFIRLESNRYFYDADLGRLTILNMRSDRTYGVGYRVEYLTTSPDDDLTYGMMVRERNEKDTLILKLVSRPNIQPGFKSLWARQLRNIYNTGQTNVNLSDAKINVWYLRKNNDSSDVLDGAPDKVVTILRVDQVNNGTGAPPPDGKFDLGAPPTAAAQTSSFQSSMPGNTVGQTQAQQGSAFFNPVRGEILFPSLEPFREGLRDYFRKIGNPQLAEEYIFDAVYDTTVEVARLQTARDRFVISGEATGTSQGGGNRIALGAWNIAPGSVRVTLDGTPLKENTDYVVEYYSGILTVLNPRAMLPTANLSVELEQTDQFTTSTKTMLGVRADMQVYKSRTTLGNIGMTFMLYNQALLLDRVRLNDEPVSNSMIGFDGNLSTEIPAITKALDALPFLDTKEKSTLNLRGEIAAMLPDPNKRRSDIGSDNGESVAFLDDFEGAQRYITLSTSGTQWTHAALPADSTLYFDEASHRDLWFRGYSYWFNYFIGRTRQNEVYPNRQFGQGYATINDLKFRFNPYFRGIYNRNPNFVDTLNPHWSSDSIRYEQYKADNKYRTWGGMQRLLSTFNTNFDNDNIDYIEIMMRVAAEPSAEMYIDIGQISEDIIPNNTLDTEDGANPEYPIPNNIIDPGEDIGIDRLDDAHEKAEYPAPLSDEADPARDNYTFNFQKPLQEQTEADFLKYNNFEGNASLSEAGQFPDKEILNNNNGQTISLDNSYFTYKVNLNTNDPSQNQQIVGGGAAGSGWYLWRIPVRRPYKQTGNPQFSNIQYIRVWAKGGVLLADIADWRFVGAQWQRSNAFQPGVSPYDSVLSVAFVNVEENSGAPDYYTLPPGVQRPRQLLNPDPTQDIRLNEQSLSLGVRNLRYNDERMAVRILRPTDIFNYKQLKFFIHGDGSMPDNIVSGATPTAYAFIRFGIDSDNYYEYRRPLLRGWQDVGIKLTELATLLKQSRAPGSEFTRQEFAVPGDPLASYAIKGTPILTKVQFIGFGIANPADRYPNELTTTMWVDELRLIEPVNNVDWAAVGSAELKLADVGTIHANYSTTLPNFHKLEERFGNRTSSTAWSFQAQGSLEKFLPKFMSAMKLPISYSHTENLIDPQFAAQSDVELNSAADAEYRRVTALGQPDSIAKKAADNVILRSQTVRVQDNWALTGVKLGIPVDFWLIRETLNRITVGYSYGQTFERSPVAQERFEWQWRLTMQYALTIPQSLWAKPFGWAGDLPILSSFKDWKINFLPSNFSTGLTLNRARSTEQSRFLSFPSPVSRNFTADRSAQFSWRFSEKGLLSPIIDYNFGTQSTLVPMEIDENGKQRSANDLFKRVVGENGKFNFGEDNAHTQTVTVNFRPQLPEFIGLGNYLENTGSYSSVYTWRNALQPDPALADVVKQVSSASKFDLRTNFKLKPLADKLWGPQTADTSGNIFKAIGRVLKTIFLDFETLNINFRQDNSSLNPGVFGGTGLTNFWRGAVGLNQPASQGARMAYQLGLVEHPHGDIGLAPSGSFPFFKFVTYDGIRPANSVFQESFTQKSGIEMRTNRQLWPGATLDLNWKSDFAYNKLQTVTTNSEGHPDYSNIVVTTAYSRSYLSLPKFLFLAPLNNTVEHVISLYNARKAQINEPDTLKRNQLYLEALSESFHDGLESFAFLPKDLRKIMPSVNWTFRWDGIEKWGALNGIARRISLEHAYVSTYTETALINDRGKLIQAQQIQTGFQPVIGLTMNFDEKKLDGTLNATLKYNSRTNYSLLAATTQIKRESAQEITLNASYNKRKFPLKILGLDLENDMEFAFLGSFKRTSSSTYDILNLTSPDGQRLDGSTQIKIEPSARYAISNRVTVRAFISYEATINEGVASPGFNTTQVGVDVRISIAGGR